MGGMKLPIYQVDAFTDQLFAGNPAAVVLLDRELPDKTLQQIAAENNLSETAFLLPGKEVYSLRWFTPALEVDLCGHATLASAFVLFQEKLTRGPEVRFETRSGVLKVRRDGDLMELDFPSRPPVRVEHSAELAAALGAEPLELYHAERDWMALMSSEREVRHLKPDFSRLGQIDGVLLVPARSSGESFDSACISMPACAAPSAMRRLSPEPAHGSPAVEAAGPYCCCSLGSLAPRMLDCSHDSELAVAGLMYA